MMNNSVALVCLAVLAVTAKLLYNVYLHPLSAIPGPFWARASGLPSWYHAWKGDRHIWLWQLFEIHGYRVRVTPQSVVFRDADAFADIYHMKANVQRSRFYLAMMKDSTNTNTLSTLDPVLYAQKRKLLNLVFTDRSVRAASSFVFKHVDRWNELMIDDGSDDWSSPINFSDSADRLILDIMSDLCFGRSLDIKEPGMNALSSVPQNIAAWMRLAYTIARSPFIETILWLKPRGLDKFLSKKAPEPVKQYFSFISESVKMRLTFQEAQKYKPEMEQRRDMFHFLCEAKDPDTGLSAYDERSLRSEASLLIIAGVDTTSATLCAILFYLSLPSQKARLDRLVKEIRSTFPTAQDIVMGPELLSCVYLKACIDEALRLCPSPPSELPREVRSGGIRIKGEHYPASTIVGWPSWANHRDETFVRDANVYRPERWIVSEDVSEDDVARIRAVFHPFAAGPGNCVGRNLAMLKIQAVIARTLWRFDIRRWPGSTLGGGSPEFGWGQSDPEQFRFVDAYVAIREGPVLQFRRRND